VAKDEKAGELFGTGESSAWPSRLARRGSRPCAAPSSRVRSPPRPTLIPAPRRRCSRSSMGAGAGTGWGIVLQRA
jgi:hypothetical protein